MATAAVMVGKNKKAKSVNYGKAFENDFKNSIPAGVFYERKKDDTSGYKGVANAYDCILFKTPKMYLLELKTTANKTSFSVSNIRDQQMSKLKEFEKIDGVIAGFVVNFRSVPGNETYFIKASQIEAYLQETGRKSVTLEFFRQNTIKIPCHKKITRYTYLLSNFLESNI